MKRLYLVFALVALATGQKHHKSGKHGKSPYIATSPGGQGEDNYGGPYDSPYNHHQGAKVHHGGGADSKTVYPLLLSDTRTLNQDGTINFQFQADNGLQQGETVDADGTRRGFYSYPGADGKQITVKYTAGKNGFIAEGDHLPLQPQSAPHSDKDSQEYSPKQKHSGGLGGQQQVYDDEHDDGSYRPGTYRNSGPSHNAGPSHHGGIKPKPYSPPKQTHHSSPYSHAPSSGGRYQGGPSSFGPGPSSFSSSPYAGSDDSSSFSSFGGDDSPPRFSSPAQTRFNNAYAGAQTSRAPVSGGRYSGAGRFPGGGPSSAPNSFGGGGPRPSYSPQGPSYSPQGPSYNSAPFGSGSASSHRPGFTANNPYQPAGAGPYNGNFDLGNSGHFSIDFAPGPSSQQGQGFQPEGSPSYNSPPRFAARQRPSGRGPTGTRGQY